jgi:23S rRNA (uracil1939-C5)-methyltransferase
LLSVAHGDSVAVWVVSHQMDHDLTLTVRPERFIAGGEALVRIPEEPVTFVRGALPGEVVRVQVTARKKQWRRAEVTEVLEPSPQRVVPPCPKVAMGCGGCDWQHLNPAYQLEAKTQIAVDAIVRGAGLHADLVQPAGRVNPEGYRTTMRVRGDIHGRAGLYASGTHQVVDVGGCLIAHPGLAKVLEQIRIDPGVELSLRISDATGQITATWESALGGVHGLGSEVACGDNAHLVERVAGVDLQVSAGSFFQSGPEAAALLVTTVRDLAPEVTTAHHLVDAYGGIGLFAATLAPGDAQITLIESGAAAVADAHVNLAPWRDRVDFQQIAVEDWVATTGPAGGQGSMVPVDVVIADPARQGLDRAGVSALVATLAPVMILVSCDPAAAARDLRLADEAGYEVQAVKVLDLFPHTHHVEVVSRLVRRRDMATLVTEQSSDPYRAP